MAESAKPTPQLELFNSMTKKKELFEPLVEGKVRMYVCGVTPYDFSHIGHARAYVAFDVLYRYLKFLGYEVEYVRNFTDIDDKVIICLHHFSWYASVVDKMEGTLSFVY
jgi:cysteinyl-tRNA synthetase